MIEERKTKKPIKWRVTQQLTVESGLFIRPGDLVYFDTKPEAERRAHELRAEKIANLRRELGRLNRWNFNTTMRQGNYEHYSKHIDQNRQARASR